MSRSNRGIRIIDCTAGEILDIGRQLIDYYFAKKQYFNTGVSTTTEYCFDKDYYKKQYSKYPNEAHNPIYQCEASDLIKEKDENV